MLHLSWVPEIMEQVYCLLQVWSYYHVKEQRANELESKVIVHLDWHDLHRIRFSCEVDSKNNQLSKSNKKACLCHVLMLILLDIWVHHHHDRIGINVVGDIKCHTISSVDLSELPVVVFDLVFSDHIGVFGHQSS